MLMGFGRTGVRAMEGTDLHSGDDGVVPVDATGGVRPPKPVQEPLVKAVRSLRRWMIALTVLVTVVVVVICTAGGMYVYNDYFADRESDVGPNPAQIQPLKDAVSGTFGDDLESVDAYQVVIDSGDPDTAPDRPYAVTYKLRGSSVTVSGLVDDVSSLNNSGLTPTAGPLDDQLSNTEFKTLMTLWAARTDKPMGFVYSYGSDLTGGDWQPGDTIDVNGKTYKVADLWCVNEGWTPKADATLSWDDVPDVQAAVYLIDHKAGTFTYVGSEPAQVAAYGGGADEDY